MKIQKNLFFKMYRFIYYLIFFVFSSSVYGLDVKETIKDDEPDPDEPDPETGEEIITVGYVIFKIRNSQEVIDTGITMEVWVKGNTILNASGEVLSSGTHAETSKKILLKKESEDYYVIINNISRSNEKEIRYDWEWAPITDEEKEKYKLAKGGFTVEVDDAEVKEGIWKEGDTIE